MGVEDLFPEPAEFRLRYCIQCDEHPCAGACPTEAIKLDEKSGAYYVDRKACNACGACVEACPHDGCWLDPTGSYAIKCDLCGGIPQCVEVCPKRVLKAGD
jgi:Fe-S-cluster-containing hydrogenase component 2